MPGSSTGARGGIGRRARFRSVFRKEWWFDSTRAHQPKNRLSAARWQHGFVIQPHNCRPLPAVKLGLRSSGPRAAPRIMLGRETVFDWATLRLTWEPRMLSILRIMVGLLYLQHGL